jgi:hypothetical protein
MFLCIDCCSLNERERFRSGAVAYRACERCRKNNLCINEPPPPPPLPDLVSPRAFDSRGLAAAVALRDELSRAPSDSVAYAAAKALDYLLGEREKLRAVTTPADKRVLGGMASEWWRERAALIELRKFDGRSVPEPPEDQ